MDAGGGRRLRLFAAVAVPDRHKESVAESVAPLKALLPGARWTKPATWHVTLKFFGEVPEGRLDDLQQGIGRALVGEPAVESRLQDVGAFPNLKRARVLWAGIEDSRLMLTRFAERIEAECGFPEDRALHPHLTLARLKEPAAIDKVVDRFRPFALDPEPFFIDRVTLFRSYTERSGSRYEVLGEWELSTD